jgi:5-hydroxyisourate hydrolase-like protein (transthyretin family)
MIPSEPKLSVVVVDGRHGQAVEGLEVELDQQVNGTWQRVVQSATDSSGAISVPQNPAQGSYSLKVNSSAYYATLGATPSLMNLTVTFWIPDQSRDCVVLVVIDGHTQFTAIFREDVPADRRVQHAWQKYRRGVKPGHHQPLS